jgi:hypothetical protein
MNNIDSVKTFKDLKRGDRLISKDGEFIIDSKPVKVTSGGTFGGEVLFELYLTKVKVRPPYTFPRSFKVYIPYYEFKDAIATDRFLIVQQ